MFHALLEEKALRVPPLLVLVLVVVIRMHQVLAKIVHQGVHHAD